MIRASEADNVGRTSFAWRCAGRAAFKPVLRLAAVVSLAAALACGSDPPTTPTPPTPPPQIPTTAYLVGAGDIADCTQPFAEATAKLLDSIPGTVFTVGDNVYPSGTAERFANCYASTWGRHLARTRPAPGNHEYDVPGATPYFEYFAGMEGSGAAGYYAFDAGNWRVLVLNSAVPIAAGTAQYAWVQSELAWNKTQCTLVLMHHPLFSSSQHGPQAFVRDVWRVLYQNNVELVVAGHDHGYERFAPQDPDGRSDPTRGLRLIVAGTGGCVNYAYTGVQANSEVRAAVHGVLKLTLQSTSYTWQFVPIAGESFTDSGTGTCR
jgi:acid phosphatase type 7